MSETPSGFTVSDVDTEMEMPVEELLRGDFGDALLDIVSDSDAMAFLAQLNESGMSVQDFLDIYNS
jgi:hypothetical protein